MSEISFENQVAIVTGAGGGLGRTYALDIARRGGAVVVNDLGGDVSGGSSSVSMADQVVAEIKAAGGRAIANYASVTSAEGAANIVDAALQSFGRIDVLINNAGNMRTSVLADSREEDFSALLDVHLLGSYHVTKAVWPHMCAQSYGRIIFTASSAGMFGNVNQGCYGAAKAGVFGLMNTFAQEGRSLGILCNAIMPFAATRMTDKAQEDMTPERIQQAEILLGKLEDSMSPQFTTGLVTFLASRSCIDGHGIYSSCGGRMARVFVGVSNGWQGSRQVPATAEDIFANFSSISDMAGVFYVPQSPSDELKQVLS